LSFGGIVVISSAKVIARFISVGLIVCSSAVKANDPEHVFAQFQDAATSNPFTSNWYLNQLMFLIRDKLDRQIYSILITDPVAERIMTQARYELEREVLKQRTQFLSQAALASNQNPKQYPEVYEFVVDIAKKMGFPASALEKTNVFIAQSGEINAFTYSPLRTKGIDIVIYTALLKGMSSGQLEAVLAHELTHQMAEHVLMGVTLTAIFNATGLSLIPEEGALSHKIFSTMLRSQISQLAKSLHAASGFGSSEDTINKSLFAAAERVTGSILADAGARKKLVGLTGKILSTAGLSEEMDFRSQELVAGVSQVESLRANGGGENKGFKEFQAAMVRLTRSQETTADRGAIVSAGADKLSSSMAWLAGGDGANVEAFENQNHLQMLAFEELGLSANDLDTHDHPLTLYRATGIKEFLSSREFKILKDPFLRTLDLYIKMTRFAADSHEKTISGKNMGWRHQETLRREHFINVSSVGARLIADLLMEEIENSAVPNGSDEFPLLTKYLGYFRDSMEIRAYAPIDQIMPEDRVYNDNTELGKPGRIGEILFSRLMLRAGKTGKSFYLSAAKQIVTTMGISIDFAAQQQRYGLSAIASQARAGTLIAKTGAGLNNVDAGECGEILDNHQPREKGPKKN
jgi:Zn-dependent protease with chaperone function